MQAFFIALTARRNSDYPMRYFDFGMNDMSFVTAKAEMYVANAVKLQAGIGATVGFEEGNPNTDEEIFGGFAGFALQIMAKFLPSKRISPIAAFQYDWKTGIYEYSYYYRDDERGYAGFHAFNITAGVSINFGKRAR